MVVLLKVLEPFKDRTITQSHSWLDQLVRVDIIRIVDEIETIEADYKMKQNCYRRLDEKVVEFLTTEYRY